MASARKTAFEALNRVEQSGAYAAAVLASLLASQSESKEASLAHELVFGVLRHRPWLDKLLEGCLTGSANKLEPSVRNALRLGAYQLAFLDRIPARAAVSETVGLTRNPRTRWATALVNAVLRRLAAMPKEELRPDLGQLDELSEDEAALRLGLPTWLLRRLTQDLGKPRALSAAMAFQAHSRRTLRINPHRMTRAQALALLGEQAKGGVLSPWAVDVPRAAAAALEAQGVAAVQDEGSQLVALALDARAGDRILDACAGRGGKTAAIASSVGTQCDVTAVDVAVGKLDRLQLELESQGLSARVEAVDLTAGPGVLEGAAFDKVLVDAPCSGTGTLGRRPEIRWRLEPKAIGELVAIQSAILSTAASLVAPGGRLVYAVCSLCTAEGFGQAERLLGRFADFEWCHTLPSGWPTAVELHEGRGLLCPGERGTDGYQIAVLERKKPA
ncbi:MAG: 16S rRNA (cytosine(967)-C(5))-methyltransferase RsmB [Myxococcota bacterium]|jgi:16S rRNA (cytosine967-C5)-methyltransferase|nr:16S rRNA (cytosine(967)-C(5))-methyltransferase RsmB [Myxococcota bacterium]